MIQLRHDNAESDGINETGVTYRHYMHTVVRRDQSIKL